MKIFYLLLIFTFFSCGRGPSLLEPQSRVGIEAIDEKDLSGTQELMAQKICFALRSKNINYRDSLTNEGFEFKIEKTFCNQRECSPGDDLCVEQKDRDFTLMTELISTSNSAPMEFNPINATNEEFYHQVQTHETGEIKHVCEKLLKGDPASNTYETGQGKKQFVFYTEGQQNFHGFSIIYFKRNESKSYREVRMQVNLDSEKHGPDRLGLIEEIIDDERCPDESVRSRRVFSQEFIK